jgi:hypothetical protein
MKGRAIAEVWYASGTVIAVSVEDDRNACEALTLLKELDSQGQIDVMGCCHRDSRRGRAARYQGRGQRRRLAWYGRRRRDRAVDRRRRAAGRADPEPPDCLSARCSTSTMPMRPSGAQRRRETVRVAHNALLTELTEQSPEVVDTAMTRLGGRVLRRPIADVEAEKEARKELRKARREHHEDEAHAKVQEKELKAKLEEPKAKPYHNKQPVVVSGQGAAN